MRAVQIPNNVVKAGLVVIGLTLLAAGSLFLLVGGIPTHVADALPLCLWLGAGTADLVFAAVGFRKPTQVLTGVLLTILNLLALTMLAVTALGLILFITTHGAEPLD